MQRGLSIVVLVLLLAPLALPVALAGGASALPLCCRPGGAHHCSGGMAGLSLPGDGFRGAAGPCPYFHARLLPNAPRAEKPVAVPALHVAPAVPAEPALTQPPAPATRGPSPRAPPALSSW